MKKLFYLSIISIILTGCHSHSHDHDHAQEGHTHDTNLMLSGYNNEMEVFAEAEPFAVGKTSSITLYLTDLKSDKPAEVTSITTGIIVGNQGIRSTENNPISPGIFLFSLKPEVAGDGKLFFDIQTTNGISKVEISGITIYDDAHKAEHVAEEENQVNPNAIAFTKAQQWKIDFKTVLPKIQKIGQIIKTTAQVQSSQSDETIITAKASGVVVFRGNDLVEGKAVSSGQALFSISGAGLAENSSEVRFAEAKANYSKAEAAYNRAKSLVEDRIVSQKDFLEIEAEYETSKALYENLTKNVSSSGQRVSSPLTGFIKQLYVGNGEFVEEGQALAAVSGNKSLMLRADVQPKYANLLPFINSANIKTSDKSTYTLDELNGKVLSYGRSLSDGNYLLPVIFQIDNKAGFIPGGFVEMYIKTQSDKETLTVPNSALTEEQGIFFVYVQLNPESFEKREVVVGVTDGVCSEIISGINETERIVSKGAVSVKLAQASGALDPHAGHVH